MVSFKYSNAKGPRSLKVNAKRRGDPEEPLSVDRAERCSKSNVQQSAGVRRGGAGLGGEVSGRSIHCAEWTESMDGLYIGTWDRRYRCLQRLHPDRSVGWDGVTNGAH